MSGPDRTEVAEMLRQTLDDHRLSRAERRALREVLADMDLDDGGRDVVRHQVFAVAREALTGATGAEAHQVIDWVEDVVKLLAPDAKPDSAVADVLFSPGDECRRCIARLLRQARLRVDICVFTITDDRVTEAILEAHRRGVKLRIITDNDKAEDLGSDAYRIGRAGVPVRVDFTEHHMHHKFAVFDSATVVTGSYNWTRSAASYNQENMVVSDDRRLVAPYQRAFEALWQSLGPPK